MTITAKVIADSVSPEGIRLSTLQCRYPKFIHGEAKTHRVMRVGDQAYELLEEVGFMDYPEFSRNASSSRAIPVSRLIQDVMDDPAMPVSWGRNRPGMQATEELEGEERQRAIDAWLFARDDAVKNANRLNAMGVHKQLVNRVIEPWCHINVVATATELGNFFALRRHPAAQPEMKALADAMWDALQASAPRLLRHGEWHLPYVTDEEFNILGGLTAGEPYGNDWDSFIKLSVARCARVSCLTQEGKPPSVEDDLKLYDRLVGSKPLHASPAEHQATPDYWHENEGMGFRGYGHRDLHGNLNDWIQYRKQLEKR